MIELTTPGSFRKPAASAVVTPEPLLSFAGDRAAGSSTRTSRRAGAEWFRVGPGIWRRDFRILETHASSHESTVTVDGSRLSRARRPLVADNISVGVLSVTIISVTDSR